jgi:tripartite-type tricarboxylate transporter receptor subunit TctC
MKFSRRKFLHLAAGAAALPIASQVARAQAYPTRPVTMIVPFGPGGTTDVGARIVAEHMSRALGQRIVIENIPGAGGTTGATRGMRASPDGYTIQLGHMGTHAIAPAFYPNLAYKPDVDFAPIGLAAGTPIVILGKKDFPPKDLKEFIPYVKANAGKLNVAHAGVGSVTHMTGLLLNTLLGAKPAMVPFNSAALAMNAIVAGHVDYMCSGIPDVVSQFQGGTIKAYAIATAERSPSLPNVPTTREAGLPEFQVSAWNALFAPKGTPAAILDRLTEALDKALDDENTRKRLLELGSDIPDKPRRGQAALAALVKSEIARWTPIIKAANVKAE